MSVAYFAEKIPTYWTEIKNGSRTLTSFNNVKWTLRHIMKEHNITKVYAYNCRFDYLSLATTQRWLTKSKYRYFFPYGTEFHDILALSRNVLKRVNAYREFCKENAYLTNFTEEHTALADCEIEYKILLKCMELDDSNFETKMW